MIRLLWSSCGDSFGKRLAFANQHNPADGEPDRKKGKNNEDSSSLLERYRQHRSDGREVYTKLWNSGRRSIPQLTVRA